MNNHSINLVLYSGHGEIVGGDAKYFFELINDLPPQYLIEAYSDINLVFEKREKQWLQKKIPIHYLDTAPRNFILPCYERFLMGMLKTVEASPVKILATGTGRFNLFYITSKALDVLSLRRLREDLVNLWVFYRVLRKHKNKGGIFHYNNGGYPGKRSGIIGLFGPKHFGLKTVMTIQNYPIDRKAWAPLQHLADSVVKKYCDMTITVADKIIDKLDEDRGLARAKMRTIYHGLPDIEEVSLEVQDRLRTSLGLERQDKILLITANLGEDRKGHHILFKALAKVLPQFPRTHILVVGDGELRGSLEGLAADLGLKQNIHFLGHRTDISELNALCDMATIPSIMFEGIPYTIRAAMRAGKPVVTTKAGGCEEAVFDGVNGYIVKQSDVEDLAEAIKKLLANDELRKSMGIGGRKIFLQLFLQKNKIQEHIDLYTELLS